MKRYAVRHLVLCEVSVWRTIEVETFEDALEKMRSLVTVTSSGGGADYEIVHDVAVKEFSIKELA
jgi:hypothetical protein